MTANADVDPDAPKKGSKMPLVLGLIFAVLGGAGGFYAMSSGLISGDDTVSEDVSEVAEKEDSTPAFAFVAIDPLVISLPGSNGRDHLRFSAQLEVSPAYAGEVEAIKPRIVDVLNGYLRAIDIATLEDPSTLIRLRAQMLRRIQVVTGPDRVNDLLIMEFVLS